MNHEKAIRDAAGALNTAILAARSDGYRVDFQLSTLAAIPVSETAAVKRPEPPPEAPAPKPAKG